MEKYALQPIYHGTGNPAEVRKVSVSVNTPVKFNPVNGQADYLAFAQSGSGVVNNAGVYTITPISGEPEPFTLRFDTGNSSERIRRHYLGNRITSKTESIDLATLGSSLTNLIDTTGQIGAVPAVNVENVPIFPNSKTDPYAYDSSTVLTWDKGGSDDNILPYVTSLNWRVDNQYKSYRIDPNLHITKQRFSDRLLSFNLVMKRVSGTTLWDDFVAFGTSGTKKALYFKIYNNATDYKSVQLNNCSFNVSMNSIVQAAKTIPVYMVSGMAETASIVIKDGLDAAYYGV